MQTFLPSPDFEESASLLDNKRLGKQRVETLQIMHALITRDAQPWIMKHWVTRMWLGYEYSLLEYQVAICTEWHVYRGFEDTCLRKTMDLFWRAPYLASEPSEPYWLGNEDLHRAYQSNLIRKRPDWYVPLFSKDIPDDLSYVHPLDW